MVVWGNLTETLDCLPVFVYHSMVQIKMSNCLLNLKKVRQYSVFEKNLPKCISEILIYRPKFYCRKLKEIGNRI